MKKVISCNWGGFYIPHPLWEELDYDPVADNGFKYRNNQTLIDWVLSYERTGLEVVFIPDEATDYMIISDDGVEDAIYVLDGKIHYAESVKEGDVNHG